MRAQARNPQDEAFDAGLLRGILDHSPAMIWMTAADGSCTYLNPRWYEVTGQTEAEALGFGWLEVTHPDDRAARGFLAANAERQSFQLEYRLRTRSGAYRWARDAGNPRFAPEGVFLGYVGAVFDIHDRKLAEQRQNLLVNELNHRVKNTLATVQAIASQTLQATPHPDQFREAFEDRLVSLGRAHDLLTASAWSGASLRDVAARVAAPWTPGGVETEGPDIWLDAQQALSVSMALHELATNAAKHGALSKPPGKVSLRWRRGPGAERDVVQLVWKERGGPRVRPPTHRGFGSRLLERGLGRELHGAVTLAFPTDGVECRVTFPLRPSGPAAV